jgi:hypothetical protein
VIAKNSRPLVVFRKQPLLLLVVAAVVVAGARSAEEMMVGMTVASSAVVVAAVVVVVVEEQAVQEPLCHPLRSFSVWLTRRLSAVRDLYRMFLRKEEVRPLVSLPYPTSGK